MHETKEIALDDLKHRCLGKTSIMVKVLGSFVSTSGSLRMNLQDEAVLLDSTQLFKALHAIKGVLREIAALNGVSTLEQLESKLKASGALARDDIRKADECIQSVVEAAEKTKKLLEEELLLVK